MKTSHVETVRESHSRVGFSLIKPVKTRWVWCQYPDCDDEVGYNIHPANGYRESVECGTCGRRVVWDGPTNQAILLGLEEAEPYFCTNCDLPKYLNENSGSYFCPFCDR